MNQYNKLVRDKIPDIILSKGLKPITARLRGSELVEALIEKLFEEANEIKENPCVEELADLEEVILAIAKELGISSNQLDDARKLKAKERGQFNKGIFLKGVEP